jgi:hypothetical protein
LPEIRDKFDWVCFLDIDEFIGLRRHSDVKAYLSDFPDAAAVSLFWRMFGHNGHFHDPTHLVTTSLTRRRRQSGRQYKTFTRPAYIQSIESAHYCSLRPGSHRLDANGNPFHDGAYESDENGEIYPAYVNHYYCRSFSRWMDRPRRGTVAEDRKSSSERWKQEPERCLRAFVETVALDFNEYHDDSLARYEQQILEYLDRLGQNPGYGQFPRSSATFSRRRWTEYWTRGRKFWQFRKLASRAVRFRDR